MKGRGCQVEKRDFTSHDVTSYVPVLEGFSGKNTDKEGTTLEGGQRLSVFHLFYIWTFHSILHLDFPQ